MLKKAFAALAVAGVLALGGASAASAVEYPDELACTADPGTIAVGATSVITCTGLIPGDVVFSVSGTGVVPDTLSSIVLASTSGTSTATKVAGADGVASVNFAAPAEGDFEISVTDSQENSQSATVTVTAEGDGDGGELPATGGDVPAAAIWLGVGAIAVGGIAVAAAVARRRANAQR